MELLNFEEKQEENTNISQRNIQVGKFYYATKDMELGTLLSLVKRDISRSMKEGQIPRLKFFVQKTKEYELMTRVVHRLQVVITQIDPFELARIIFVKKDEHFPLRTEEDVHKLLRDNLEIARAIIEQEIRKILWRYNYRINQQPFRYYRCQRFKTEVYFSDQDLRSVINRYFQEEVISYNSYLQWEI